MEAGDTSREEVVPAAARGEGQRQEWTHGVMHRGGKGMKD